MAGPVVVGVVVGIINTVAGGGSLIALPALIFFGLPSNVANATNRLGILFQSGTAVYRFWNEDLLDMDFAWRLLPPACIGAVFGALLAVDIDERLFRRVIGIAMPVMLAAMLLRPKKGIERLSVAWIRPVQLFGIFLVGFYGGFLQAGVGIFFLMLLALVSDIDLVRANALKSLVVAVFTLPVLVVYIWNDLVSWEAAIALGLGSGFGGWLGARMSFRWGPPFIRWVLVVVVLVSSCVLLFEA